ncbi:MAG: LytTR family DNA-binding domain-containing protein [Bacteroidales bacterium]
MINCIAIDDEPLALDLIEDYCSRLEYLDLKKCFTKPSEASDYLNKFPVDLLFLDIQMPDISGIEFYKGLKTNKPVIFTTAHSEYAVEGFNLNAVDYLLKPIMFSRFEQAVAKTYDHINYLNHKNHDADNNLFVRSEYKLCKIAISDIRYIEGLDNYVRIFTENSKPVISHMSLKAIYEKLPGNMFLRVHRSFIINSERDISYCNRNIRLGEKQIPVGISYEENVKRFFGLKQETVIANPSGQLRSQLSAEMQDKTLI